MTTKQKKATQKPRRGWRIRVQGKTVHLITPSSSVWSEAWYSEACKARTGAQSLADATGLPLEIL